MNADAPPTQHKFRCLTLNPEDTECGAESGAVAEVGMAQAWTFEHLRDNPGHTSFAEVIERPWVMWRGGPP